jgi:hypothetical protein
MADQRIEKWQDWMEHGVAGDVFGMHLQRQTWDRLADLISANDDLNGSVSYFLGIPLRDLFENAGERGPSAG